MSRRSILYIAIAVLMSAVAGLAGFKILFAGISDVEVKSGVARAFPGAILSVGARGTDKDGNLTLSDVALSWPGGAWVSIGKAVVSKTSNSIGIGLLDLSVMDPSGFRATAEEIRVSGLTPGGSLRDFSAASVIATAPVLLYPDRFAVTAARAEASSIVAGVPASIVLTKPSMLAPGRLEVAVSAGSGRIEFDGFLRSQMKSETFFSALEKSMRMASLENVDIRFAALVRARAREVSVDLRPVLGGGGGARRGSVVFISAVLSGFDGPAHIARSMTLEGRQLSVSADVERSDAGAWSIPSFAVEQPELGSVSGRLADIFDPGFSGTVVYEERTLLQRVMQAIVLFENSSVPSAQEKITGWLCDLFERRKDPVIAAFVLDPTHIQISWHGRPGFGNLSWEIPVNPR